MREDNILYRECITDLDGDLSIDYKKFFYILWNRKVLILKVFSSIFLFFVLLTFIIPPKYTVYADLYINKSNNSNLVEINPYFIDETGGNLVSMGIDKTMNNELELMMSPLVIDNVIRENNLIVRGKKFGIFKRPNEGEYISTSTFLGKGKNPIFEIKKNTNVITIKYTAKKPELAYNIVNSIISNYIKLHSELNTEKAKADKKLIASEYEQVKSSMERLLKNTSGLPIQSLSGVGNVSVMSAFSNSASQAVNSIQKQYIQGEKSRISVEEEAQKVANLAAKLEWAKMVEEMSVSSKVLVIKKPILYRSFEKSSPKLKMQIIFGLLCGFISSLCAIFIAETLDKKVTYSLLDNNAMYNTKQELSSLEMFLLYNNDKNILAIAFSEIDSLILNKLEKFNNIKIVNAENDTSVLDIRQAENILLLIKPNVSEAKRYKEIKRIIKDSNKTILKEILL